MKKISFKSSINKKNIQCVLFFLLTLLSCRKFVEIGPPKNELTTVTVFNNNSTANAAITVIYSQMVNEGFLPYVLPLITGLYSDELTNYSTDVNNISFYTNGINPLTQNVQDIWAFSYKYIYEANAVLDGIHLSNGITPAVKQQLSGEARFLRAFWYFYLVNLFGDIPLVTTTDYTINSRISRSSKEKVYEQIITDLKDAQELLSSDFVGADGITPSTERVRASSWAATSLLARVYLFNNDYVNAEIQANSVISNTSMFTLEPDLNNVFLMNSKEAIWQLQPAEQLGFNTPEGANFILNGPPETGAISRNTTISNQLLKDFDPIDKRRTSWIDSIVYDANTYYYPFKYKIAAGSPVTEYSMILRLAEQYLIRAECKANNNNIEEAKADLNIIRNRAGLPSITAVDKASLLTAIERERRLELFTEWGHRWLDLKRNGKTETVMSIVSPLKGGSWNSSKELFPIPQNDRENNPNLTQNPGY